MTGIQGLSFWPLLGVLVAILLSNVLPSDQIFQDSNWEHLAANLTIVVTGANSGLGYATVEHLARIGTARSVILACRSQKRCQDAKNRASAYLPESSTTQLLTLPLDLANRSSIETFATDLRVILSSFNIVGDNSTKLDVLINNAGIFTSTLETSTVNGVEEHIYVNHLGHVLLTHLLWPTLEESKARVVFISSISALFPGVPTVGWFLSTDGQHLWSEFHPSIGGLFRYLRSKRANLFFADELHHRRGKAVSTVASHPGYTRTEIWSNGAKLFPRFIANLVQINRFGSMSSSKGAWTQVWAALDRENVPSGSYVGPRWYLFGNPIGLGSIRKPSFPYHHWSLTVETDRDMETSDDSVSLWDKTLEVLGIEVFGDPAI